MVNVSGGVGDYRIAIDGVGESLDNPAEFRIEGVVCEALRLTGTAFSGATIQAPLVIDLVPTGCPTPTPPPVSEACVTFDDLQVGTPYGHDGKQQPGDEILRTPEGVRVTVEFFQWSPQILANLSFAEERGSESITVARCVRADARDHVHHRRRPAGRDRDRQRLRSRRQRDEDHPRCPARAGARPGLTGVHRRSGLRDVRHRDGRAEPNPTFGKGPYLSFNNVNLAFDWRGLPFRPSAVQFAFRDQGGNENLAVNGSEVYPNELVEAPQQIGDVRWSWADPEGDRTAVGTLEGPIERRARRRPGVLARHGLRLPLTVGRIAVGGRVRHDRSMADRKRPQRKPAYIEPMRATLTRDAFDDDDWLFETKWDGFRVEAVVSDGTVELWTRGHQDASRYFGRFLEPPTWIDADERGRRRRGRRLRCPGRARLRPAAAADRPLGRRGR